MSFENVYFFIKKIHMNGINMPPFEETRQLCQCDHTLYSLFMSVGMHVCMYKYVCHGYDFMILREEQSHISLV